MPVVQSDAKFPRPDVEKSTVVQSNAEKQKAAFRFRKAYGQLTRSQCILIPRNWRPSPLHHSAQPCFFRHPGAETLRDSAQPYFSCISCIDSGAGSRLAALPQAAVAAWHLLQHAWRKSSNRVFHGDSLYDCLDAFIGGKGSCHECTRTATSQYRGARINRVYRDANARRRPAQSRAPEYRRLGGKQQR